jgi:hypothetical protein
MSRVILAAAVLAVAGVAGAGSSAHASVTCSIIPSMCPPSSGGGGGKHPVPEPGTLGLLALGAAAGYARLRTRKKNQ